VTGLSAEQLLASGWHSILHPEDAPDYLALVYKAIQERTSFRKRMRAKTMDGQWHWFDSHGAPWLSANGEYRGHIGISIDITDAVQAEDALKVANLRKDEFLATLAHELRNPLAPISNVLHLLKHAHADGQHATDRLIGMMDRQVTHMVRLWTICWKSHALPMERSNSSKSGSTWSTSFVALRKPACLSSRKGNIG